MQHLMNDEEYQEYLKNKKELVIALKNKDAITEYFSAVCDRKRMGYCDKCPIQDTVGTDTEDDEYTCMAGISKNFSK